MDRGQLKIGRRDLQAGGACVKRIVKPGNKAQSSGTKLKDIKRQTYKPHQPYQPNKLYKRITE